MRSRAEVPRTMAYRRWRSGRVGENGQRVYYRIRKVVRYTGRCGRGMAKLEWSRRGEEDRPPNRSYHHPHPHPARSSRGRGGSVANKNVKNPADRCGYKGERARGVETPSSAVAAAERNSRVRNIIASCCAETARALRIFLRYSVFSFPVYPAAAGVICSSVFLRSPSPARRHAQHIYTRFREPDVSDDTRTTPR